LRSKNGREKVGQICEVFQAFTKMLSEALEVPEVPKIIDFCEMLFDRQVALYEEYKNQFSNIYRPRVSEYFKDAPKRSIIMRGEGNSRTQESPSRVEHNSVPIYARQNP
jgi:hypothetical protein